MGKYSKFIHYWFLTTVILAAITIPPLVAMGMDAEIKLAKLIIQADIAVLIMEDFCILLEEEVACNLMVDLEDEINTIYSYDFIFINYDNFREQWIDSKECSELIKQWTWERDSWYEELDQV